MTDPEATSSPSHRARRVPGWLVWAGSVAWRLLVVALALLALAMLARALTPVLVPVLVALLLAGVLAPVVDRLGGRGPSWLAPLGAVLVVLLVVVGAFASIGLRVSEQLPQLRQDLEGLLGDAAQRFGIEVPPVLPGGNAGPSGADGGSGDSSDGASSGGGAGVGIATEVVRVGTGVLFGFFLTLALTFLFLKDGRTMWAWVLDKVGAQSRDEVDAAGRSAWSTTGSYVRGLTVVALFDAVATGLGLLVLGVPLVATLAALQLVLSYVPTIGAFVAGAAAVLVAYASGGLTTAILVLVLVVVVQQVGNDVIEPWIFGRSIGLHPALVLVVVTAGGVLWGIAGAFLFVPLAAALSAVGHELWTRRHPGTET